ncbi:MAG: CvpA family protein [Acidobacteria bacterium]|nr:CvpA family protein [Acidobacteriota bacterium]
MERAPILEILTVLIMLATAALAAWRGLFRAAVFFFLTLAAGFLAFNFWEPVASGLDWLSGGMDGSDALSIGLLFLVFLIMLWLAVRWAGPGDLSFPPWVKRFGGAAFGLATGYVLAAILICALQTLPLSQRFLGYDPVNGIGLGAPDRVWLAVVHRASGQVLDRLDADYFDPDGSFILRYARYRRLADGRAQPESNQGEFPEVLNRKKAEPSGP